MEAFHDADGTGIGAVLVVCSRGWGDQAGEAQTAGQQHARVKQGGGVVLNRVGE